MRSYCLFYITLTTVYENKNAYCTNPMDCDAICSTWYIMRHTVAVYMYVYNVQTNSISIVHL